MDTKTKDRPANPTDAQIEAAEALIKTEPYSQYAIMKHEIKILQDTAKDRYGDGYQKYMPLVLLEFVKLKIEQGAPPSGLNRSQRRAMKLKNRRPDGTRMREPKHAYTEKIRVRALKAKKRAARARRKAARSAA